MHYWRWKRHGDPNHLGKRVVGDPVARFWHYVNQDGPVPAARPDLGPCWIWAGAVGKKGYGQHYQGEHAQPRLIGAHRYAYMLLVGPIPGGTELDHLCRVTTCVNPAHLEAVPHRINVLRGESPAAHHARKERCRCGAEFVRRGKQRVCPTCLAEVNRQWRATNVPTGVGKGGINRAKTECSRGHFYTPENTYRNPKTGNRDCKKCRDIRRGR